MIYFSTICLSTASSTSNQIVANVVFCKFLKIICYETCRYYHNTILGFHRLRVIRDKMHLLLEICIFIFFICFFIFDFSERLIVLLFA